MPVIALDGCDGSGKTTQAKLLRDYLSIDLKLPTEHYIMPGATAIGQELRRIVKSKTYQTLPITERLLFAADTAQFMAEKLILDLAAGKWVVVDRWSPITDLIYGRVNGISLDFLDGLQKAANNNVVCDLYIVFRIPYEAAAERVSGLTRPQCRIEAKGEEFLRKICAVYDGIGQFGANPPRLDTMVFERCKKFFVVDAMQSVAKVKADIVRAVKELVPMADDPVNQQ